jgi:glycosyltransferase involved in cell wall biosynthesis
MRIAFVAYDFGEYSIRHANALARHGEVLLLLRDSLAAPHANEIDPAVQFAPFEAPRLRQPWRQARSIQRLLRTIHAFRPDVVHFQRGHLWFNLALPALRRYPLVVTVHDPRRHLGDRGAAKTPETVMRFGYRRADRIIVHGQQLKETLVHDLDFPSEKIHVVPHIAIGQRRVEAPAPEEDSLVLFFGRIWEYKGLDYLIRAEPLISRAVPNLRILIAGDGEGFDRYRRLMANPDRFEVHHRWISDEERTAMFQRAAVVVLPYVEATQSGVVPVAYAFGKPVVATATGGLPEVVEHGRTGLLVPPRDESALAAAIVQLLRDEGLRRRMGEAGRSKIEAEAAPDRIAEQTVEVYRRAIADRQSASRRQAVAPSMPPAASARPQHRADAAQNEVDSEACFSAALRLHDFLAARCKRGELIGPDPGVRWNYRVGRFIKGGLGRFAWNDDLYYVQAQGYWILANWRLFDLTEDDRYRTLAVECSRRVLLQQRDDGGWDYPNPEWKGRTATTEGNWGTIGLIETYRRSGDADFLAGALRWRRYLLERTGFQKLGDELAVNYFAGRGQDRVPNNSVTTSRVLAELSDAAGASDDQALSLGLFKFICNVQTPAGEFPYTVPAAGVGGRGRPHFQCFQYNAFQSLNLMRYLELTDDAAALPLIQKVLGFLATGQAVDGHALYQCGDRSRAVTYHTAALAAAFFTAGRMGLTGHECEDRANRAYRWVLDRQRPDGSFPHSEFEYHVFRDRRSYPRYLAMILDHLLHAIPPGDRHVPLASNNNVQTAPAAVSQG